MLPDGTEWVFEYDENENRTTATDPLGATTTFTFNQRGHLAAVSDALGNVRTIETDPAGLPLVITEADGNITRLERDAFGRVTTISRKPETWTYEWDADDRMTDVRTPDGTHWRYHCDILGRRIAKHRLDNTGQVGEEILFAWDGTTLLEETTTNGSRSWTHDGLRPIAQLDLSDEDVDARFYSIITDLVGTPTELITPDGDLTWHAHRTLWGAPTAPADALTPLRFPGQYTDPETGLGYNYLRYYDPDTGRYLSQDPLGLAPAPNPNTYVANPTSQIDPLGLSPCTPIDNGRQVSGRFPNEAGPNETLFRRTEDGQVTSYQVYDADGLPIKRVDVTGRDHGGVPTPHVVEFERHTNPHTGQEFIKQSPDVRRATPDETRGLR